jgi:hypothetical protein
MSADMQRAVRVADEACRERTRPSSAVAALVHRHRSTALAEVDAAESGEQEFTKGSAVIHAQGRPARKRSKIARGDAAEGAAPRGKENVVEECVDDDEDVEAAPVLVRGKVARDELVRIKRRRERRRFRDATSGEAATPFERRKGTTSRVPAARKPGSALEGLARRRVKFSEESPIVRSADAFGRRPDGFGAVLDDGSADNRAGNEGLDAGVRDSFGSAGGAAHRFAVTPGGAAAEPPGAEALVPNALSPAPLSSSESVSAVDLAAFRLSFASPLDIDCGVDAGEMFLAPSLRHERFLERLIDCNSGDAEVGGAGRGGGIAHSAEPRLPEMGVGEAGGDCVAAAAAAADASEEGAGYVWGREGCSAVSGSGLLRRGR